MEIEDVQLGQLCQILDLFDVVLAEHEDSQGWNSVQIVNLLYMVVVKVEKDQIWQ